MQTRKIFDSEHEMVRDQVRKFFDREVAPDYERWEDAGIVPRELWRKAGENGLLCTSAPEAYGGLGVDRRYAAILLEEQARGSHTGPGFSVHSEIAAPYLLNYGTEEQKKKWLPKMASGESIAAIGLTEPGAGSDLQNIKTSAIRDGDHYVVNGQKTFISNGINADLVFLAVKTDPAERGRGMSMLIVERDTDGFERGTNLNKLGCKAQDTAELFFRDARVPVANRLGEEGQGFKLLLKELPWERLQIALSAVATVEGLLGQTLTYVKDRKAFGKSIVDFQTARFNMAEMYTAFNVTRAFVDECLAQVCENELTNERAAMAKYWATDLLCDVADRCLQLHGGYGYIWDYPVARYYADARVMRIYGGANEIMKEIIGKSMV